jgi:hypothetical protein
MTSGASTKTKLVEALNRLKGGETSGHTDGRVTVANVAAEAGVSRATAYRCTELLRLMHPDDPEHTHAPTVGHRSPEEKAVLRQTTERGLRAVIRKLLNRIVAMQAREKHLLQRIAQLESAARSPKTNVLPISPSRG